MLIMATEAMRQLEQATVADGVATWETLMENAGRGVAQQALAYLGNAQGRRVVVLVGPGNNGGDGLVVARHLHDAGALVSLVIWNRQIDQDANWQACRQRKLRETLVQAETDMQDSVMPLLTQADLIIDALLGMGISRDVTGVLAQLVATGQQARGARTGKYPAVLAIDVPTGIHSDTGRVMGVAVSADMTVATGLTKYGLLQYPGNHYAGTISVADIGIPTNHLEKIMSKTLERQEAQNLLPVRPLDSHKGTFGKVLVIAGSLNYPGAAVLATSAAGRVGAGLVTLATARSISNTAGRPPEITLLPLPEAEPGTIGKQAAEEVAEKLATYQALLVGPGLGTEKPVKEFLGQLFALPLPSDDEGIGFRVGVGTTEKRHTGKKSPSSTPVGFVMQHAKQATDTDHEQANSKAGQDEEEQQKGAILPVVIDADGLNMLAEVEDWAKHMPAERCILTPHPGEMKRLLGVEELGEDRVQVAIDAAAQWRQVIVLKGATTVVAAPDGHCRVFADGNPALATAGTGDVLAGAIAGLLAQGMGLFEAAVLGVYLHAQAGSLVRDELGDTGTLASDLLLRLPQSIKLLKES